MVETEKQPPHLPVPAVQKIVGQLGKTRESRRKYRLNLDGVTCARHEYANRWCEFGRKLRSRVWSYNNSGKPEHFSITIFLEQTAVTSHHSNAPGVVLALGGGGAAGLAHIGVLQVLNAERMPVRAVVGTSIGAQIGAFLASGMPVDDLAALATAVDWKQTLQLFFPDLPTGGLISGVRIVDFLNSWIGKHQIEELNMGYAAVATDLVSGEQVVLDSGDLVEAVRASISVPGVIARPLREACGSVPPRRHDRSCRRTAREHHFL